MDDKDAASKFVDPRKEPTGLAAAASKTVRQGDGGLSIRETGSSEAACRYTMSELEASVLQMLESYKAAVFAKDVDAFVTLYDPAVRIFDMWGGWSYEGLSPWRAMAVDWFGSLGKERVGVDFDEVQVTVTGDAAVVHSFVTYRALSAEGKEVRSMQSRHTWVLTAKASTWKVIHEHSSAPADFDTKKLILKR